MAKRKRLTPAAPEKILPQPKPGAPGASFLTQATAKSPISQVAGDAATAAALEELAQQMRSARVSGRLIQTVPECQIDTNYLVRDRVVEDDDDMLALMQSLQSRGQQTPVELVELDNGCYGLISGWRRLKALRRLLAETGEPRFGDVLAILRQPESAADAYQAMIEENEIRVGLSYYERARIAAKAVEQGVYPDEKSALLALFATASRAKRSKIRSFLPIYHMFDGVLRFPGAIPERLGLQISKALEADSSFARRVKTTLAAAPPETVEDEQTSLRSVLARARGAAKQKADKRHSVKGSSGVDLRWLKGDLVLTGAGVTPALAKSLRRWLDDTLKP